MRTLWSDIYWALGFELVLPFDMVLVATVGYPLEYSINMFFGLELEILFGSYEVSLVLVSIVTLSVLIIFTGYRYLAVLSLVLPLVYPLEYPNPGLAGIIIGMSLVNPLGYLLGYIRYINWCFPLIRTWQFL